MAKDITLNSFPLLETVRPPAVKDVPSTLTGLSVPIWYEEIIQSHSDVTEPVVFVLVTGIVTVSESEFVFLNVCDSSSSSIENINVEAKYKCWCTLLSTRPK